MDAGDKKIKRIAAHRQTWFDSGNIDFTSANRQEYNKNTKKYNARSAARWKDLRAGKDLSAVLFDFWTLDKMNGFWGRKRENGKTGQRKELDTVSFSTMADLLNNSVL